MPTSAKTAAVAEAVAEYALPTALFLSVDRAGPVPLYHQVANCIEAAIVDGRVPRGARIDNEIALAGRLRLSRPTIRQAIQALVDKGLLVRRRGIGTQVVRGGVTRKLELTSLHEDLRSAARAPSTRVLDHRHGRADEAIAGHLGVPVGAPVLHIRRLRLADEVPLAILENVLPSAFADISRSDLERFGLYQLLGARGVDMRVARQRIGARIATAEESRILDVERRSAVLTMERVAFDSDGHAVEFGHHAYRPDLYSFEVTLVGK
ncbi:GntR family transcriptional regulator [Solimonas terrae]|uniref:GntR family transcriptional regulator n=1 Tax=Solimonas terrae TaxID=1396819 RepID=UPI00240FEE68|nr:GntR family transcriptional regulator [Solimonas terrae]